MDHLDGLPPGDGEEKNLVLSFGHALFTPEDTQATELLPDDRPYAAALIVGVGINTRRGDRLRTTLLRLGMVGPSAKGESVQNGWHTIVGSDRARGWQHQLRDEPVFQLLHEQSRRLVRPPPGVLAWDAIVHWGLSVGNLSTHANAGLEWRFGKQLPDDFGSDPLRPAGENLAPSRAQSRGSGWSWHVFATLDARRVAYNIALDGNAWKDSHQVDKRPWVADAGLGLALTHGAWKISFARFERSREFEGQSSSQAYGSITISRS
jgi:lipid A 3-O-deacylase